MKGESIKLTGPVMNLIEHALRDYFYEREDGVRFSGREIAESIAVLRERAMDVHGAREFAFFRSGGIYLIEQRKLQVLSDAIARLGEVLP